LAFDDLLTSEQFGVGGSNFGRGYDDSEIIGDNGYAGKAELQYNEHLGLTYADTLQPYGFFDYGEVSNRHALSGEKKEQSLASTGVGLRIKLTNNFSGQLEIAQPLTKDVATEQNKDPRFFFGITAHY
jgi:hemolysin activation/secretion protein